MLVILSSSNVFSQTEAIDELAEYLGVGEEVAAATRKAMYGSTNFRY